MKTRHKAIAALYLGSFICATIVTHMSPAAAAFMRWGATNCAYDGRNTSDFEIAGLGGGEVLNLSDGIGERQRYLHCPIEDDSTFRPSSITAVGVDVIAATGCSGTGWGGGVDGQPFAGITSSQVVFWVCRHSNRSFSIACSDIPSVPPMPLQVAFVGTLNTSDQRIQNLVASTGTGIVNLLRDTGKIDWFSEVVVMLPSQSSCGAASLIGYGVFN